jgi:hypothetical protein
MGEAMRTIAQNVAHGWINIKGQSRTSTVTLRISWTQSHQSSKRLKSHFKLMNG